MNHSWGIQTNIFETNIINLAINFIFIVIFFVGNTVKSLLSKRQKSIFKNLQQSKRRAIKVQQNLLDVQTKIEKISDEVSEIQRQSDESIKQQKKQYQNQISTDLQKLEESQKSTIDFQRRQIRKQISQEVVDSTLRKVDQKLKDNFNEAIKKAVSFWSVEKFKKF
uniref:ATP synthase subunit b, chloroplastic n=1 Tax=Chlorodesmis fastigiata TaxID=189431 RepID=A0A2P0QHD1_CHLFS|nr:ATP synthase CF0 subunit I [Chlorodesmis fastigiata]ARO74181.1 ATP synthase CF0 subunit I [Chlorodesmis fastigiata]